jgi:hypothetical protein
LVILAVQAIRTFGRVWLCGGFAANPNHHFQEEGGQQMKTNLNRIICGFAASAILTGLFPSQTEGASACPPPPAGIAPVTVPAGGFGLDGDLQANTPVSGVGDWVAGPSGSGGFVLNNNGTPVNGTTTFHLTDLFNNASDNNFAGGKKVDDNPNIWTWVENPVNSKQDINNAVLHFTTDANGHNWLVVSADRLSNNGDSYIDFEFLQNTLSLTTNPGGTSGGFTSAGPNCGRTVNDFILTLSFTKGGTKAGLCFSRWMASSSNACGYDYVDATAALPAGAVFAAVNTTSTSVPYGAFGKTNYVTNTFAEAAVDLTALLADIDPCLSVGIKTVFVKTKESQSPTATIVDFINPLQIDLKIGATADAGPDQTKCSAGDSTTFTITGTATAGIHPITSMAWSVISGSATIDPPVSCTNCTTLGPTDVHVTSSSATVRLTVTDSANCVKTDDVVLTVSEAISSSITPASAEICDGNSQSFTANVTGGTGTPTFSWTGPNGFTSNSQTINVSVAGTYTVTITDGSGCTTMSSATLAVNPNPQVTISGPNACQGAPATLTANVTGGTGTPTFSWTGPNGFTANTQSINISTAGIYSVIVTDAKSCSGQNSAVVGLCLNP